MGATNASVQDCTGLRTISLLKDLMNDYDYLKKVLSIFSTHVEMFHSQFHEQIVILSAFKYFVFL